MPSEDPFFIGDCAFFFLGEVLPAVAGRSRFTVEELASGRELPSVGRLGGKAAKELASAFERSDVVKRLGIPKLPSNLTNSVLVVVDVGFGHRVFVPAVAVAKPDESASRAGDGEWGSKHEHQGSTQRSHR